MWYKVHISATDCKRALAAAPYHPAEIYTVIWPGYFTVQWTSNAVPSHHTSPLSKDFLSHTPQVEFSKKWNGANAQGKCNTVSTSTVSRYLWKQLNTKKADLFFSVHGGIASCKSNDIVLMLPCKVVSLTVKWRVNTSLISAVLFLFHCSSLQLCLLPLSIISSIHILLCHSSEYHRAQSCRLSLANPLRQTKAMWDYPVLWSYFIKRQNTCACLVCFCLFSG